MNCGNAGCVHPPRSHRALTEIEVEVEALVKAAYKLPCRSKEPNRKGGVLGVKRTLKSLTKADKGGPKLYTPIVVAGAELADEYANASNSGSGGGAGAGSSSSSGGGGGGGGDAFSFVFAGAGAGAGSSRGSSIGSGDGDGAACACNCSGFAPKSVKRAWQLVQGRHREDALAHVQAALECTACGHSLGHHRLDTPDELVAAQQRELDCCQLVTHATICVSSAAVSGTSHIFNLGDPSGGGSGGAHSAVLSTILDSTVTFYGDHRRVGGVAVAGGDSIGASAAVGKDEAMCMEDNSFSRPTLAPFKGGFYGACLLSAKEDLPLAIIDLSMPEDGNNDEHGGEERPASPSDALPRSTTIFSRHPKKGHVVLDSEDGSKNKVRVYCSF